MRLDMLVRGAFALKAFNLYSPKSAAVLGRWFARHSCGHGLNRLRPDRTIGYYSYYGVNEVSFFPYSRKPFSKRRAFRPRFSQSNWASGIILNPS